MKKKNVIFHGSLFHDIIACIIITLFIFTIGLILKAWTGSLKGDDAYYHVARVQYIISNFPNITWYHQSFSGYNPLGFEPPFLYFVIALLQKASGLSIILLYQIVLFLGMAGLGLSLYVFSRLLKIHWLLCIVLSLLPFTIPETWNWFIIGGAYLRIPALPLFILSIAASYGYICKINSKQDTFFHYIAVLTIFTLLAFIHPLLWQWAFLIIVLLLILGIQEWKRKLATLLRLFIPVSALAAWVYIPLFNSYFNEFNTPGLVGPSQYIEPLKIQWLVYIPSRYSWSNSLGLVLIPLALVLSVILLWYHYFLAKHQKISKLKLMFIYILVIFSMYFFAFGWLPMPSFLYLMSSYDNCLFLGLTLALFCIVLFSILLETDLVSAWNLYFKRIALAIIAIFIVLGTIVIIPFLNAHESIRNPSDKSSLSNSTKTIIDVAVQSDIEGYRIENTQRIFQAWLYSFPYVETTGGRSKNDAPHKYYNQWADSTVSYGLNSDSIANIYSDDRPQIYIPSLGGPENYYPSMFWLDWFGAAGPVMAPQFYPQGLTSDGYKNRPQYFRTYQSSSQYGDFYFYKFGNSSPIVVAPSSECFSVPFQKGENPIFYTGILNILSSLNLNSQWVIPIKLDDAANLANFGTSVVEEANYAKNKKTLDDYVNNGGKLVVFDVVNQSKYLVNTIITAPSGLSFLASVSILNMPDEGQAVVTSPEGVVAFTKISGKGEITFVGTSIASLENSGSLVAAELFINLVDQRIETSNMVAPMDSSEITYMTNDTSATIFLSENNSDSNKLGKVISNMQFTANVNEIHNQVNWNFPFSQTLPVDGNSMVYFSLWNDGSSINDIGVTLQLGNSGYLGYDLPKETWEGWKSFILPLSYFKWKEGDLISAFSSVTLCFNENYPYPTLPSMHTYKVANAGVISFQHPSSFATIDGTWEQENLFNIRVKGVSSILWKESYMANWLIKDDQGQIIDYYFAGPGMIYFKIPEGTTSLSFQMPEARDAVVGIIISLISIIILFLCYLLLLIIYFKNKYLD